MPTNRPNILFITTDQQRGDALGLHDSVLQTPNLDALASSGVLFTRSYANAPICMAARASWVTGRYPHNHGVFANGGCVLAEEQERTWANLLRGAGYQTAFIGKHHFFNVPPGTDSRAHRKRVEAFGFDHVHQVSGKGASARQGCNFTAYLEQKGLLEAHIDRYLELGGTPTDLDTVRRVVGPAVLSEDDYIDAYTGRQGIEWIESCPREPFCLWLSFPGPHSPFDGPGQYAEMYDAESMELSPAYFDTLDGKPGYQRNERQVAPPEHSEAQQLAREAKAYYFANTSLIDHWVGRAMDVLRGRGLLDNTLIIFTSDHGEMLGEHGVYSKTIFYEASARVPFIISWPEQFAAGRQTDALVETVDVYRTIADVVSIAVPHRVFGRSLLPVLHGEAEAVREAAFSEFGTKKMVRRDDWKLVYDPQGEGAEELYNLADDPHELHNRVRDTDARGTLEELKSDLLNWMIETQAPMRMVR